MNFIHKDVTVCTAPKTGFSSTRELFRAAPKNFDFGSCSRIYCVVREPRERLLSAWIMMYRSTAWNYYYKRKRNIPDADWDYIQRHAKDIIENPVHHLKRFIKGSGLDRWIHNSHFAPQWHAYRSLVIRYPKLIQFWNHRKLSDLFVHLGVVPVVRNVGAYPKDIDRDTLLKVIPQYDNTQFWRPYREDLIMWNTLF